MITELDRKDTEVIAVAILKKLNILVESSDIARLFPQKSGALLEAISAIESIEPTWECNPSNEHTYGRKHAGEIIKLWSVPEKSAQVLENLVVLTGAQTILEVGTSAGYAALHLAQGATVTGGTVHTIELLKGKADLAESNFAHSCLTNIHLIRDEASSVLSGWNGEKVDLVFLDADKENYGKYLDLLVPIMNVGGIIVADNVNDYGHMMEDYLQKVSGTHLPKTRTDHRVTSYYLAALDNGLMITKKISD